MWVRRLTILISSLLCLGLVWLSLGLAQEVPLRSDAQQYLSFLQDEQVELEFQLAHQEIGRMAYLHATKRIAILKQLILNFAHSDNPSHIPDYHVVGVKELNDLIPQGVKKLNGARPNQIIEQRWRFIKVVPRGEVFYVLERLDDSEIEGAK